MGQRKTSKGLDSLSRATDILSTLLAQQVRELNARQRENRRSGAEDPGTMKGLKEATAVLKDLAAVARSLNDQGVQAEGTESGVVLLPRVEEEEPLTQRNTGPQWCGGPSPGRPSSCEGRSRKHCTAARPAAEKAMHWSSRHCVRWIFRITER